MYILIPNLISESIFDHFLKSKMDSKIRFEMRMSIFLFWIFLWRFSINIFKSQKIYFPLYFKKWFDRDTVPFWADFKKNATPFFKPPIGKHTAQAYQNTFTLNQYLLNSRSNMHVNFVYWISLHPKKAILPTFWDKHHNL